LSITEHCLADGKCRFLLAIIDPEQRLTCIHALAHFNANVHNNSRQRRPNRNVFGFRLDHAGTRHRIRERIRCRLNWRRHGGHPLFGLGHVPYSESNQADRHNWQPEFC